MKDDDQLIYEAYMNSLMSEAPVDPGGSFEMPTSDITGKFGDLKTRGKKGKKEETVDSMLARFSAETPETRIKIIDHAKDMLAGYEGGTYKGSPKEFALDLAEQIKPKAKEWGFKTFRSPHIARVVVNALLDLDVITKDGKVQDVDKLDNEEEVLDMPATDTEVSDEKDTQQAAATKFDRRTVYNVDPLAGDTLPKQHREVAEYVAEHDGDTGSEILEDLKTKMLFNNPSIAGGFDGSEGKLIKVLNDLVQSGVLIPSKDEAEDPEKTIDTVELDDDDQQRRDRDYIDSVVRQAEFGAQTPTYGLDDI